LTTTQSATSNALASANQHYLAAKANYNLFFASADVGRCNEINSITAIDIAKENSQTFKNNELVPRRFNDSKK